MSESSMERQPACSGGRLAWFFAGALAGVVLGVLYAPRSGKETRDAISGGSRDLYGRGCEFFEKSRQLVDDANDLFERGRKLARGGGAG
jgi:gas vesicle protein